MPFALDFQMNEWLSDSEPPAGFSGTWVRNQPGAPRSEIEYVDGVPNGRVRRWSRDCRLLFEGHVKDGLWHGALTHWGANGDVLDVSRFDHGTGIYRIYSSSGKLAQEISLRAGKRDGITRRWNGLRELVSVERYWDGNLIDSPDE